MLRSAEAKPFAQLVSHPVFCFLRDDASSALDERVFAASVRALMFSLLADKLQGVFRNLSGKGKISESNINDALREVRMALLEADVHFQVAKDFIARVKEKALGEEVLKSVTPGQQIVKIFHDELTTLLGGDESALVLTPPARILIVGLDCIEKNACRNAAIRRRAAGLAALASRRRRKIPR